MKFKVGDVVKIDPTHNAHRGATNFLEREQGRIYRVVKIQDGRVMDVEGLGSFTGYTYVGQEYFCFDKPLTLEDIL